MIYECTVNVSKSRFIPILLSVDVYQFEPSHSLRIINESAYIA
jgi:hypothetical protein